MSRRRWAFVVITVLIAYLSLVLGELVPKRIALQRVERVALFTAAPIDFIARLFRPFIVALSFSTNAIVRIFGIDPTAGKESISGEELRDLVAGHEELSEDERNLIDDVFEAGERELRGSDAPSHGGSTFSRHACRWPTRCEGSSISHTHAIR